MIISARRAPRLHNPSRSQKPGIVLGLRYERRFVKELRESVDKNSRFTVEHNPWFVYKTDDGKSSACSPDVLLHDNLIDLIYVIELKYTWVSDALPKLNDLYCPVVKKALSVDVEPLLVVKRLTPISPLPRLDFLRPGATPLFQWVEDAPLNLP